MPGSQRLENALFQWDEVMQRIEERKEGANEDEESVVEFRVADANSQLRARKDYGTQFPVELTNMEEL